MIYGFGGRVDNDSNAITVIDEENMTAETKGYVNGEYVEFSGGGGGGSSDFSTAEVTVVDGGSFRGAVLNNGRTESYSYNTDGVNVVVLSSGSAQIVNIDGTILSTSGQIQSLGRDAYLVTGACTITYDNSIS